MQMVLFHLNIQNMSFGTIFQVGGGFNSNIQDWIMDKKYKLSTGFEYRIGGYSFYAYPISISYEYHIPLNSINEPSKNYFSILLDF